jgi:hypothetical protein
MLALDRILQHQYHDGNYENYSNLIHDLLQVGKHDELTLKNHHQHSLGSAPLSEVHYSVKFKEKADGFNNHQKNFFQLKKDKCNDKKKNN